MVLVPRAAYLFSPGKGNRIVMPSRTSATILQADKDALAALEAMPGYDPRHERYRVTTAQAALAVMTEKQTISARADAAAAAARDEAAEAEAAFHTIIVGAKEQVRAQYGSDSNEVQAVGLKKKSDRKRPVRRVPKPKEV